MERMKTFLKYALWVIGFFILSELLINVGLNVQYKPIERKDNIEQVQFYQAEATLINGRMRGVIKNDGEEDISNKYVEVDFYSERDVYLGKKYIKVNELSKEDIQSIEILFELNEVGYYEVKIVDQKDDLPEIKEVIQEMLTPELIVKTIIVCCFIL